MDETTPLKISHDVSQELQRKIEGNESTDCECWRHDVCTNRLVKALPTLKGRLSMLTTKTSTTFMRSINHYTKRRRRPAGPCGRYSLAPRRTPISYRLSLQFIIIFNSAMCLGVGLDWVNTGSMERDQRMARDAGSMADITLGSLNGVVSVISTSGMSFPGASILFHNQHCIIDA